MSSVVLSLNILSIIKPLMGPNSALCLEREKKKINYLIRSSVMSAKLEFFSEFFV